MPCCHGFHRYQWITHGPWCKWEDCAGPSCWLLQGTSLWPEAIQPDQARAGQMMHSQLWHAVFSMTLKCGEVKEGCVVMCIEFHQPMRKFSDRFHVTLQRHNYITPISTYETLFFKVGALFYVCLFLVEKKKHRSSWDLNLDHLSFIQTLFPLSHWRSGWHRSRVQLGAYSVGRCFE